MTSETLAGKPIVDVTRFVAIPVSQLVPAPWNYKKTGEVVEPAKAKIRRAIRKRGQVVNLIVREIAEDRYEVVNGNHRLEVFVEEGVEQAICCNMGTIDQATAEMIALETNELNVEADVLKLGGLLRHVLETVPLEEMTETLPYDVPTIENHVKAVDFNWDDYREQPAPVDDEKKDDAPPADGGEENNRGMIALMLPADLATALKAQLKRWPTDADAIRLAVEHLSSLAT